MTYLIQIIIQLPLRLIYKIFYRSEVRGIKNIQTISGPVLIISNHITLNDPWLLGASLPLFSRLLKTRVIGGSRFDPPLDKFYRIGIIPFIYWIFNVVSLPVEGSIEDKILPIVDAIKNGDSILIFPEGGRSGNKKIKDFKRGAAEIFLRTGVQILPVAITPSIKQRGKLFVTFGEPITPVGGNVDEITKFLHDEVEILYKNAENF